MAQFPWAEGSPSRQVLGVVKAGCPRRHYSGRLLVHPRVTPRNGWPGTASLIVRERGILERPALGNHVLFA